MTIACPFYPQIRPAFAVKTTMVPSPIAGCPNNISSTRYLPDDNQPSPISPDIFRRVFCLLQFFANDLLEIFPKKRTTSAAWAGLWKNGFRGKMRFLKEMGFHQGFAENWVYLKTAIWVGFYDEINRCGFSLLNFPSKFLIFSPSFQIPSCKLVYKANLT